MFLLRWISDKLVIKGLKYILSVNMTLKNLNDVNEW